MPATKKQQNNENIVSLALIISILLVAYFLIHLLQLLQNVKVNGIVGSPSTYAAVPGGLLALYVLAKSRNRSQKYLAVIVLSVIFTGVIVWLFGATGAGSSLATNFSH